MRDLAQLRKERDLMKRRSPEEFVTLLREAESSTEPVTEFCRRKGISDKTYYRWRKHYGGLQVDEAKRLKTLETENAKLKKLVAEVMLANEGLKEVLAKK
jgi:putative transposase